MYVCIYIYIVQVKVETIQVVQCSTGGSQITIHVRLGVIQCTSCFTVLFRKGLLIRNKMQKQNAIDVCQCTHILFLTSEGHPK